MYKVNQDLTKNPTAWGLFSRFWTIGNEKSLHSAPHHNRPSHTTVTIKWTFFTTPTYPITPTIPIYIYNQNSPRTLPQHHSNPNSTTPHIPLTHLTNPSHSTLISYYSLFLSVIIYLSSLSSLAYIYSLCTTIITYHTPRNPHLIVKNNISQSFILHLPYSILSNIYSFNSNQHQSTP